MTLLPIIAGALLTLLAVLIIAGLISDRRKRRRLEELFAPRSPCDDAGFGRKFFSDHPERAAVAVRVRKVLSKNLKRSLDCLHPGDRLDADLEVGIEANPDLFFELETEFGIQSDIENLEAQEKSLERLVTFADLVDYVESKIAIAARTPQPSPADQDEAMPALYKFAIGSIPILCFSGLVILIVGVLLKKQFLQTLGLELFLGGFVVWGLANGTGMIWRLLKPAPGESIKDLWRHPLWLAFGMSLALFFFFFGTILLKAMLRGFGWAGN